MREVVIVSAVRTAIGSFGGSLAGISAVDLGSVAIKEAVRRSGIPVDQVNEVIMGNVLQAGLGQNPARQAAIKAGIPEAVPSMTINKVCGSGLKSISLAVLSVSSGDNDIVVAGGMESMSQAPYLLDKARFGYRMGDSQIVDSMVKDGLMDAFYDIHMGTTAENIVDRYGFSRDELDEFSASSQAKAALAIKRGRFLDEIVSVVIPQRNKEPIVFLQDEYPRSNSTKEVLGELKPAFKKFGAVTAGNSSGINDGAAAVVVMSKEKAVQLGIRPLAEVIAYASVGCDPKLMGLGPVPAVRKLLQKTNLVVSDFELIEANEAFAAQSLAVMKDLELEAEKVNVNGGAIALGHPIGASGTRIVVTLLHEMAKRDSRLGLATLCIGGGQGIAMAFRR